MQYRFGRFLLDPARRELTHADVGPVTLSARAFDVLVCLVCNPGTPVSRRDLLDTVWQGRIVDENNLAKAVASLRKALGEEFIVTVPRQGYQFVAPVRTESANPNDEPATFASAPAATAATVRTASIAFGVAAAVIAAFLLLVKPPDASDLQQSESGSAATAYDHFERGQEFLISSLEPRAVELAVIEFRQALELDPGHMQAQLAVSRALRQLARLSMVREEALRYSEQAAIEYERAASMARAAPAEFELSVQQLMDAHDWAGAEAALTAWLDTEPRAHLPLYLYGVLLQYSGRSTAAAEMLERAHATLPAHLPTINALSLAHNALGDFGRVADLHEHARKQLGFSVIHAAPLFWTLLGNGETVAARNLNFDLVQGVLEPGELLAATANREPPPGSDVFNRMFFFSVLHLDRPAEGRAALEEIATDPGLDSTPDLLNFAMFASYFGATEMSLGALGRISYSENEMLRFIWTRHMKPVREHPAFVSILEKFGLIEYWDSNRWPDHCERRGDEIHCR